MSDGIELAPPPSPALTDEAAEWARHEDPEALPIDLGGEHVTAVLVCHDSTTWLPSALDSLARLDPRPDRVVAVNNTPGDLAGTALAGALADGVVDRVLDGERSQGFAAAVRLGIEAESDPGPTSDRRRWYWLLHDDVVAPSDVLGELLRHVALDTSVDLTGPTLLMPSRANQPRRLCDSAVTVSGTGRAVSLAEPGEVLQGQLDRPERVLGLSTCGLLIRAEVYDALGGLAGEVPVFRDGVELGWRATRAGYRVRTTPSALLVHRRVGRAGLRPASAAGPRPAATDRVLGMALVGAHRHGVAAGLTGVRLVVGCLLRMLGFVLGKAPDRAGEEWLALREHLRSGERRSRLRTRIADGPVTEPGRRAAHELRPPWWHSLGVGAEWTAGGIADRFRGALGRHQDTSLDELTGDEFAGRDDRARPWWHALVALLVVLVVAAGLFGRVLAPGLLSSSQLLPGASTFTGTWARYLDPGVGSGAPPWLGLVALLATPLLGHTDWLLVLLFGAGVALAFFSGRAALHTLGVPRAPALWCAGAWALLPTVLGAAQRGSLLVVGVSIVLPLLVLAGQRLLWRRGLESTRGAFGVGLAGTVLVACQPLLLPLALLPAALLSWRHPAIRIRLLVALAVPVLLLAPWAPTLLAHPGRWLTGPDPVLVDERAPVLWRMLLGQTPGPGWFDGAAVPLALSAAVTGVIWLLALLALLLGPRDRVVLTGWSVAVAALLVAVLVGRTVVQVPPVGEPARPEVAGWLLIAFGALLVAAARGLAALHVPALLRRTVSALMVVLLLGAGSLWWILDGASGPMERRQSVLPPFIASAMAATPVRTLAIDLGGGEPRWNLLAGDGSRLGDTERGLAGGASSAELAGLVSQLVTTGGDETLSARLAELGIGYLWVRDADAAALTAVGSTPELQLGSNDQGAQVWTVLGAGPDPMPPATATTSAAPVLAVLQLLALTVVVVMAAPALAREDEDEPVARRGLPEGSR